MLKATVTVALLAVVAFFCNGLAFADSAAIAGRSLLREAVMLIVRDVEPHNAEAESQDRQTGAWGLSEDRLCGGGSSSGASGWSGGSCDDANCCEHHSLNPHGILFGTSPLRANRRQLRSTCFLRPSSPVRAGPVRD